jgi:hypothetical protein
MTIRPHTTTMSEPKPAEATTSTPDPAVLSPLLSHLDGAVLALGVAETEDRWPASRVERLRRNGDQLDPRPAR